MEIASDVLLKGDAWSEARKKVERIFVTRPNYMLYILAMSVGILHDKRIKELPSQGEDPLNVPRTVLTNHNNSRLDLMFQAAILSSLTVDYSEEERLQYAFAEKTEFKKMEFLTQFANYGITQIAPLLTESDVESMENLKQFLDNALEDFNDDAELIIDEDLMVDVEI